MNEIRNVFVYGTLRVGEGNYQWVAREHQIVSEETAMITGHVLHGLGFSFPYCVETGNEFDVVTGEILTFHENAWKAALSDLDQLEGVPHHYDRHIVTARLTDGQEVPVWLYRPTDYMLDRALSLPIIPSGDWLASY